MKKIILYKCFNPNRPFGGYGWSIKEVKDTWNNIYSEPYFVEIPDDFNIGESVTGEKIIFKDGCKQGYELTIGRTDCENSSPFLIGGSPVETIKLKVLEVVNKKDGE